MTGGSGFLGRNLIAMLNRSGVDIAALARTEAAAATVTAAGADAVSGSLADAHALAEGMRGCDVVFHCAARQGDAGLYSDFHADNVVGTSNVLAAARATHVPRLVHVSTEAVLAGGRPLARADETWPLPARPSGMYARSKGEAERLVAAQDGGGLTTVIVRPRLIWGAGDSVHLPRFAAAVRDGSFRWIDGGRYLTSTCHVRNVCTGMILAAERGRGGEVYFLTDGPPLPYRQFVGDLLATQGLVASEKSMPGWVARARAGIGELQWRLLRRDGAPPLTNTAVRLLGTEVTVSDEKARRELGYDSPVDRRSGLEEMRAAALSPERQEAGC